MPWISVRNWRKFQHYDPTKRQPPWIKLYTELMSDDAFLSLSGNDRAALVCLWLEYASSRCRIRLDDVSTPSRARFGTRSLSRRLNLRVTVSTIERLNHAGYIDIVASAVLAEGYHDASEIASAHARATEVEEEKEEPLLPSTSTYTRNGKTEGRKQTEAELADQDRDEFGVPLDRILDNLPL